MIFFFSKGSARMTVTTQRPDGTDEYVVTIERPNQEAEVLRFTDQAQCSAYLGKMEQELAVQEWVSDSVGLLHRWPGES